MCVVFFISNNFLFEFWTNFPLNLLFHLPFWQKNKKCPFLFFPRGRRDASENIPSFFFFLLLIKNFNWAKNGWHFHAKFKKVLFVFFPLLDRKGWKRQKCQEKKRENVDIEYGKSEKVFLVSGGKKKNKNEMLAFCTQTYYVYALEAIHPNLISFAGLS